MAISKHFKRREFACQCGCGFDTVDAETLQVLERIREKFGPVIVTSAARCVRHNQIVGGTPSSRHLQGRAVDFTTPQADLPDVHYWLNSEFRGTYGLGYYKSRNFIHLDTRDTPARWTG